MSVPSPPIVLTTFLLFGSMRTTVWSSPTPPVFFAALPSLRTGGAARVVVGLTPPAGAGADRDRDRPPADRHVGHDSTGFRIDDCHGVRLDRDAAGVTGDRDDEPG